jgi:hypothetical protein
LLQLPEVELFFWWLLTCSEKEALVEDYFYKRFLLSAPLLNPWKLSVAAFCF